MLAFLPNIQLTLLLVFVYASVLPLRDTFLIITIYVFLDNIQYGLSLYMIPMLTGWYGIAVIGYLVKGVSQPLQSIFTFPMVLWYSLQFITLHTVLYGTIWTYVVADIPFTILMMVSSYISVLFLYERLVGLIKAERGEQ
jgi:hypothetical protein